MINLSDTHASIADLEDLAKPEQQSIIEIAPYYREIYRFGDYLVEHVQPHADRTDEAHEFRVRKADSGLSEKPVASFTVGQVQRVVKQGTNLVLFGNITTTSLTYQNMALVYDLSNPESPRRAGQVVLPSVVAFPYYYYYCGWSRWGGYWFNTALGNWTSTDRGLVMLYTQYASTSTAYTYNTVMVSLDLSNPDTPGLVSQTIASQNSTDYSANGAPSLVADAADSGGFYVAYRTKIGEVTRDSVVLGQYRYYARRYSFADTGPVSGENLNLPGALVSTWNGTDGQRMFLTRETVRTATASSGGTATGTATGISTGSGITSSTYPYDTKLYLLHQVSLAGQPAAELLDGRIFTGTVLSALVREGNTMILNSRPYSTTTTGATWEQISDRLMVLDLSANTLALAYDQPTKASNLLIMGLQKNRAFLNLQGDGIVVVDVSNPASPTGVSFLRTLGFATHLENFGDDIYVASGYFGLEHLNLLDPPNLAEN
jgi:hypothetical protein